MPRSYPNIQAELIDFNAGDENIKNITKHWLGKELTVQKALEDVKRHHLFEKMAFTFKVDAPIFILVELLQTVEFDIFSLSRRVGLYFPDTFLSDKDLDKKDLNFSESKVHQEEALSYYTDGVSKSVQAFRWLTTGADVAERQAHAVRPQCEMVTFYLEVNLPTLIRVLPEWKSDIPELRKLRQEMLLAILKDGDLKDIGTSLTYNERQANAEVV